MNPGWSTQVPPHKWEGAFSGGLKECPRCGTAFQPTWDRHDGGWTVIYGCCGHVVELDRQGQIYRPQYLVTSMGYHRKGA